MNSLIDDIFSQFINNFQIISLILIERAHISLKSIHSMLNLFYLIIIQTELKFHEKIRPIIKWLGGFLHLAGFWREFVNLLEFHFWIFSWFIFNLFGLVHKILQFPHIVRQHLLLFLLFLLCFGFELNGL